MKKILVTGVTVLDFIFHLDTMPKTFEKYRTKKAFISGGGNAANASVAISRLGGKPYLASRIGDDKLSKILINDLKKENVNLKFLKVFAKNKSSFSSVYLNESGERQVVNFADSNMPRSCNWIKNLPKFDAYLTDAKWFEGALFTLKNAKINNAPGIIDIEEKVDITLIKNASHITFSLNGLKKNTSTYNIKNAFKKIRNMTSSWICVTDGENGVYFLEQNEIINLKVRNINAKDTLGAGDVWHGAFALALTEGKNEHDSVIFANKAAAIKCKSIGGRESYPSKLDLERFL